MSRPGRGVQRHLLVDEGEVVVDEIAQHWAAYWVAVLRAAAGFALLAVATRVNIATAWIPFWLAIGLFVWAAWRAGEVAVDRFVVTNMRVFRMRGLFARSLATMPLTRILDITVDKPVIGRLLGFGHFTFESAAEAQGLHTIRYVARADDRDLTIQRVLHRSGLRGARPVSRDEPSPRDPMRTVRLRLDDI
jgi:uncharacterized membrane protein YdbT with pleckstrin-like domain